MPRRIVTNFLVICCLASPNLTLGQEGEGAVSPADSARIELERLKERVEALEREKAAREEATRSIIRDAISNAGSMINNFVVFGGTFEQFGGWSEDYVGRSERVMRLNTLELDFEIQVNDWTLGSVIFEYDDGSDHLLSTIKGREVGVDRITLDTAFLKLGDTQRFAPYTTIGRVVLPFGISTGDPVADVLTLEDPMTVEVFETRENAVLIGLEFPTPEPPSLTPEISPPQVRPRFLHPILGKIFQLFGYDPAPRLPEAPGLRNPPTKPAPVNASFYVFGGNTFDRFSREGWRPEDHFGAKFGVRTSGPWSVGVDVDYNNSIFDSQFLEYEYHDFLGQIGLVSGMSASLKANLGPVPLVAEWNGAIEDANLIDGFDRKIKLRPSAWQVSLGYQFDWNPGVEALGAQGTYLTIGYSESRDLGGVLQLTDSELNRVGAVPRRRLLVSAGEWIWDGLRLAVEYSHVWDYSKEEGGTGGSARGVFSMLTYEW